MPCPVPTPQLSPHTKPEMPMTFQVDQRVIWTSSSTQKTGQIVAVLPPNTAPAEIGYAKLGGPGTGRDHETYIVRGAAKGSTKQALYWPLVSLLKPLDALSDEEIAWCHANPAAVRALIARGGRL